MPRTQRTVMVAYFLLFLGGGVWMPYFPLYLSHLGYSGWEIGIIFGLQPALRWVSALGWAYAADRWRVRHRLLVSAALSGGLCFIPLLFVRSFAPMALVTGMIAVLHAPLIPMTDSTVMDHLAGLGGDYGRLRLWGSVAFVLGALGSAPIVRPAVAAGAAAEQHWRPDTVRPGRIWHRRQHRGGGCRSGRRPPRHGGAVRLRNRGRVVWPAAGATPAPARARLTHSPATFPQLQAWRGSCERFEIEATVVQEVYIGSNPGPECFDIHTSRRRRVRGDLLKPHLQHAPGATP